MAWSLFFGSLFLNACLIKKISELKNQYSQILNQNEALKWRLDAVLRSQNQPISGIKEGLRPYFRDGEKQ